MLMTHRTFLTVLGSVVLLSTPQRGRADVILAVDTATDTLTFQSSDSTSVTADSGGRVGWTRFFSFGTFGTQDFITAPAGFATLNGVDNTLRNDAFSFNVDTSNNARNWSIVLQFPANESGSLLPGTSNTISYAGLTPLFHTMLEDFAAADTVLSPSSFGTGQGNLTITSVSSAAVPEPSSIVFLSLVGVGAACRWRRKRSGDVQTTAV